MSCVVVLLSGLALAGPLRQDGEPEPEVVRRGPILRAADACDDYVLFATLNSSVVRLIDLDGNVVHSWETNGVGHAVLLDTGNLLVRGYVPNSRFQGPGVDGGLLEEFDWDGNLVWSHVVNDEHQQAHHDFDVLPNGNLLYVVTGVPLEGRGDRDEAGIPRRSMREGMWPDGIVRGTTAAGRRRGRKSSGSGTPGITSSKTTTRTKARLRLRPGVDVESHRRQRRPPSDGHR